MRYLILVSLVWAFSFSLIKGELTGLPSPLITALRLSLALLVFLPFLRWQGLSVRLSLALVGIGAVQYGIMYLAYLGAFTYLQAYQVALFSVVTPVYVMLIDDAWSRRFRWTGWLAALLAVAGAAWIRAPGSDWQGFWQGALLMQIANLAFAFGQVAYRRLRREHPALVDHRIFALPYAGGTLVAVITLLLLAEGSAITAITPRQWLVMVYLGIIASGLGFFWWNKGAVRTDAPTLAVMNNLVVPLGVAVALLFFGEQADPARLTTGGLIILAALLIARYRRS